MTEVRADGSGTVVVDLAFSDELIETFETMSGEGLTQDALLDELDSFAGVPEGDEVRLRGSEDGVGVRVEIDVDDPAELGAVLGSVDAEGTAPLLTDVQIDVDEERAGFSGQVAGNAAFDPAAQGSATWAAACRCPARPSSCACPATSPSPTQTTWTATSPGGISRERRSCAQRRVRHRRRAARRSAAPTAGGYRGAGAAGCGGRDRALTAGAGHRAVVAGDRPRGGGGSTRPARAHQPDGAHSPHRPRSPRRAPPTWHRPSRRWVRRPRHQRPHHQLPLHRPPRRHRRHLLRLRRPGGTPTRPAPALSAGGTARAGPTTCTAARRDGRTLRPHRNHRCRGSPRPRRVSRCRRHLRRASHHGR